MWRQIIKEAIKETIVISMCMGTGAAIFIVGAVKGVEIANEMSVEMIGECKERYSVFQCKLVAVPKIETKGEK